jgi:hypothetical protein
MFTPPDSVFGLVRQRYLVKLRLAKSAGEDHRRYAARRIISVNVARPSSVNEYGACKSSPVFAISRLRLRYWNSAFND